MTFLPEGSAAIILAAGKGTRMKSDLPKVAVPMAGRPLIRYVLDATYGAGIARVVAVVGYRRDLVAEAIGESPVTLYQNVDAWRVGGDGSVARVQVKP